MGCASVEWWCYGAGWANADAASVRVSVDKSVIGLEKCAVHHKTAVDHSVSRNEHPLHIRTSTVDSSSPALRAYFMGEGAQLNGAGCRELLQLANEGVAARHAAGETHLVKYECVSLAEARERGI